MRSFPTHSAPWRAAFTLIELLVVIAIIAVLIGCVRGLERRFRIVDSEPVTTVAKVKRGR